MESPYYKILVKRREILKRRFINTKVIRQSTSNYAQDMLRTFRILLHAEIEFYIEELLKSKIRAAKNKWLLQNEVSNILLSIVSCTECKFPNIPKNISEVNSNNDAKFRILRIVDNYLIKIKRNNGIKENNIIPIIIPLGIDYNQIDQTLLNDLSSYGSKRGDLAHNSFSVINNLNPNDEDLIGQ